MLSVLRPGSFSHQGLQTGLGRHKVIVLDMPLQFEQFVPNRFRQARIKELLQDLLALAGALEVYRRCQLGQPMV